jgi:hypothetical protein
MKLVFSERKEGPKAPGGFVEGVQGHDLRPFPHAIVTGERQNAGRENWSIGCNTYTHIYRTIYHERVLDLPRGGSRSFDLTTLHGFLEMQV